MKFIASSTALILGASLAISTFAQPEGPADEAISEAQNSPAAISVATTSTLLSSGDDDCGELIKQSSRTYYGSDYDCDPESDTDALYCADGTVIQVPVERVRTKRDYVTYTISEFEECSEVESESSGFQIVGETSRIVGGYRCPDGCLVTTFVNDWIPCSPPIQSQFQQSTTPCPNDPTKNITTTIVTVYQCFTIFQTSICADGSVYNSVPIGTDYFPITSTTIVDDSQCQ